MFEVGDKVVYPIYGAGTIINIEEKSEGAGNEKYYVIEIPCCKMVLRLACSKAQSHGLRMVMDMENITKAINHVKTQELKSSECWSQRYKDNMEKIKSGAFVGVVEVYKALTLRERKKGLSGAEKKMLSSIKQIVSSEISFSNNIEKSKAEELLSKMVFD